MSPEIFINRTFLEVDDGRVPAIAAARQLRRSATDGECPSVSRATLAGPGIAGPSGQRSHPYVRDGGPAIGGLLAGKGQDIELATQLQNSMSVAAAPGAAPPDGDPTSAGTSGIPPPPPAPSGQGRPSARARRGLPVAPAPPERPHQMLACLWCPPGGFNAKTSAGLLIHMTGKHPGAVLGEMHARQMHFHNKRVCECCGVLRAGQSRQCQTCGQAAPSREPRSGDIIVDRATWVARARRQQDADDRVRMGSAASGDDRADLDGGAAGADAVAAATAAAAATEVGTQPAGVPDTGTPVPMAQGVGGERVRTRPAGQAVASYLAHAGPAEGSSLHPEAVSDARWGDRAEGGSYWRVRAPAREVAVPNDLEPRTQALGNGTCEHIPMSLRDRYATTWAEAIEGTVAGSAEWGCLARCRARLLLTWTSRRDKIKDVRRRLGLWEQGRIDELITHVEQRKAESEAHRPQQSQSVGVGASHERQGKKALKLTVKDRFKKALMSFSSVGSVRASPQEKTAWTERLIPRRSGGPPQAAAQEEGLQWARANLVFGASDAEAYRFLAREQDDRRVPLIPLPRFAALSAPGPSGERPEHLAECLDTRHVGIRRRLHKALDVLTVRAARGVLPGSASWMLNTQLAFLKKARDADPADEDDEWLWRFLDPDSGSAPSSDADRGEAEAEPVVEPILAGPAAAGDIDMAAAEPDGEPESVQDRSDNPGGKPTVRPIQMGELLRKVVSKRILGAARGSVDAACLGARQWGVGAPGGAEGIAHTHLAIERLHAQGLLDQPLAVIQVDAENCFGRLEWDAIRKSVIDETPLLGGWVSWKHAQPSFVEQAEVAPTPKDRGAEQGDTFGPAETGVALGDLGRQTRHEVHARQMSAELPWAGVRGAAADPEAAQQAFRARELASAAWSASAPLERHRRDGQDGRPTHPGNEVQLSGGLVDLWYLDDGTIILTPGLVGAYLRAYDRVTAQQGGKRNLGKTLVTIYATDHDWSAQGPSWGLDALADLCTVCRPSDPGCTLGVALGGPGARAEQLRKKTQVVQLMHDRLRRIGKTGPELVLAQACLGVGKVTHLLRACGDELFQEEHSLATFDAVFDGTLCRLAPGCDAYALRQAALGMRAGGLGVRRASDVALPAVIASRAVARPKVEEVDAALAHAGLLAKGRLLSEHDRAAAQAVRLLQARLDAPEAAQVLRLVESCAGAASRQWVARRVGLDSQEQSPRAEWRAVDDSDHVPPAWQAQDALAGESARAAGPVETGRVDELTDEPEKSVALSPAGMQRQLSLLVDNTLLRRLVLDLARAGRFSDLRRLQELRDPSVDHTWLQRLDFTRGPVLPERDFALALQLRLGAHIVADSFLCPECGQPVDTKLAHSTCCAKAERTRGHNAVARVLFDRFVEVDRACSLEVRGLSESEPGARPADLLTQAAVPNREAALDVTIVSPEAGGAGADCVASAQDRKFDRYAQITREWDPAERVFQPLVWSCEGRSHPDTDRVLTYASAAIARRVGGRMGDVLRRWRTDLGVVLAARRARMARACLPAVGARGRYVCWGLADEDAALRREMEGGLGAYLAGDNSVDSEGRGAEENVA